MKEMHIVKGVFSFLCMSLISVFCLGTYSYAVSAKTIDAGVEPALKNLRNIGGGSDVIDKSKGLLVFPGVFKASAGAGAEYGEGVLMINGRTVDYYSTAAASLGIQAGTEKKSFIIAFMTDEALTDFRKSKGWRIGTDASVTFITVGAGSAVGSAVSNKPIVAFAFDHKGLMLDLSLSGAKVTKIQR